MILYKKDASICYEDIGGTDRIRCVDNSYAEFDDDGNDEIKISIYRYQEREHKNFFTGTFAASEILDASGAAYGTTFDDVIDGFNKGINVNDIDSTTDVVLALFNRRTNSTTLASTAVIDTRTLEVTDATGIVADKQLIIFDAASLRFTEFIVISIVSTTVTVDRLIDFAYPSGSNVDAADISMNVNGSVTPVIFGLRGVASPEGVELTFNLRRLLFVCETDKAVDLNKFGDIAAGITNGLLFRTRTNVARSNKFSPKTNGGLASLCYDWTPLVASNPSQAVDGFIARLTFAGKDKMGSIIQLPLGTDAEFVIQDDLSSLIALYVVAEGNINA